MIVHRAPWILPIAAPPIHEGWVAVDAGRIVAAGSAMEPAPAGVAERLEDVAILPGLVNAHTHLELSYLHRCIPPTPAFGQWVRTMMAVRRRYPDPSDPSIVDSARSAIAAARAAGTSLFGDVSNTLVTVPLLQAAGVSAQVFLELTGFTERHPHVRVREARARADALGAAHGDVRISVAPHAPYSVSASLLQAIRDDLAAHPADVSTVHLGETPDEVQLLHDGTGEIKDVLEELGRWPEDWQPPGVGPVAYLDHLGVLDARMLVVHGVQFGPRDLARLVERRATIVTCPRSNLHVGVGAPPLDLFYASGIRVAIGTDSLASVEDLNVFAELAAARRLAPGVPARRLLDSATRAGAEALGFGWELGTIEAGRRADLLAVDVPRDVRDVEEYLVSGIQPAAVRWLAADG